jgi:YVTN family beta-propeller protein
VSILLGGSLLLVPTVTNSAFAATGADAYVAEGSGSVAVVDLDSRAVTGSIAVGGQPMDIVASPDGSHLYLTNIGTESVDVVSTASKAVVASIPGFNFASFAGLAVTPSGQRLYVSNYNPDGNPSVKVIDTATNAIIASIPMPSAPLNITIGGGYALVATGNGVYPIRLGTTKVGTKITTGEVSDIVAGPGGGRAFFDYGGAAGSGIGGGVINLTTLALSHRISDGLQPRTAVALDSSLNLLLVLDGDAEHVLTVIDTTSYKVVTNIPGVGPHAMDVATQDNFAYVTSHGKNALVPVDLIHGTVESPIPLSLSGAAPNGVVIVPSN